MFDILLFSTLHRNIYILYLLVQIRCWEFMKPTSSKTLKSMHNPIKSKNLGSLWIHSHLQFSVYRWSCSAPILGIRVLGILWVLKKKSFQRFPFSCHYIATIFDLFVCKTMLKRKSTETTILNLNLNWNWKFLLAFDKCKLIILCNPSCIYDFTLILFSVSFAYLCGRNARLNSVP